MFKANLLASAVLLIDEVILPANAQQTILTLQLIPMSRRVHNLAHLGQERIAPVTNLSYTMVLYWRWFRVDFLIDLRHVQCDAIASI